MQNLRAGTFMPFVYPGSKEYAVKKILKMVPDHTFYAEPFCGSATVFFAKSKTQASWLNDINAELINTYKVIRDHPSEFAAAIRDLKTSGVIYNRFVRAYNLLVKRPVLQLRRFAECLFAPPRAFRRPAGSVKFTVHLPTLLLARSPLLKTTKALFGP